MSLDKLRSLPEFQNASDAEILGTLSKTAGVPLADVATIFGADTGGKWGNRAGASLDSYQAGLYGVGEAITGGTSLESFFRSGREANDAAANLGRANAQRQGAIMSYKDVGGVGDALDYVGGLAVDSLPYLAESALGGIAGRALLTGGKTALGLSRATAGTAGGVAASYPSAVGDILQNQREEPGDQTNLGAAALGGIPYAALNALGVSGAASRAGGLRRAGIDMLDNMGGIKGGLARAGVAFGKNALEEGIGETGQEMINQGFGRMAVNPNQTLFNPEANERYLESFIGGAALGGVVGGAAGGWRRSEGFRLPADQSLDDPAKPADLLGSGPTLGLGYSPLAGTPTVFPDGSVALNGEQELAHRYASQEADRTPLNLTTYGAGDGPAFGVQPQETLDQLRSDLGAAAAMVEQAYRTGDQAQYEFASSAMQDLAGRIQQLENPSAQPGQTDLFNPDGSPTYGANPNFSTTLGDYNLLTQPAPIQQRIDQNLGIGARSTPKNYPAQFQAAASEPTNLFAFNPQTQAEIPLDLGQATANAVGDNVQLTPEQQMARDTGKAVAAEKQRFAATKQRAAAAGLDVSKGAMVALYDRLEQAVAEGVIPQEALPRLVANVVNKVDTPKSIDRFIEAQRQQNALNEKAKVDELQAAKASLAERTQPKPAPDQQTPAVAATENVAPSPAPTPTSEQPSVEVPAETGAVAPVAKAVPATRAASQPVEAPGRAVVAPAPQTTQPATVAGIDATKTVAVGRSGRQKLMAVGQVRDAIRGANLVERRRIARAMGWDVSNHPTTGAPIMVELDAPMTFAEIGRREEEETGEPVTREGIRLSMLKFKIDPKVIERATASDWDTNTFSAAEFGIGATGDGGQDTSGMRVESTATKAFGQGLIKDDAAVMTAKQRKLHDEATRLLEEAGAVPSTGTAVAKPTAQAVEQVDARVQRNIEAAREAPWADEAREMWNPDNMEATDLPDTLAADWVLEYGRIRMEDGLDAPITREALAKISRLQSEIEDEYRDYLKYASDKGRNHAGLEGPARGQEDRPQIGGPDQGGSGRLEYAAAAEAEAAPEPDLGTRVRSKLKAAGQNVAKAGLTDEELAEAIRIYEQLKNTAKATEAKAEQEARGATADQPAPTPFTAPLEESTLPAPKLDLDALARSVGTPSQPKKLARPGLKASKPYGPGFDLGYVLGKLPQADSTPAPAPEWAAGHAADLGGEVAYHDADTALIQGYSTLTGQALYVAANRSGSRTRVDIRSFTGGLFTPEQKANLVAQADRLDSESKAKQEQYPNGPFTPGDSVAATDSIAPEMADYLRSLLKTLNMRGVRVFLLDPADVRGNREKYKLFGTFSSAGSAGLDANEDGSMRKFGSRPGDFYISMRPGMPQAQAIETLAHEVGHIVQRVAFETADTDTKNEIIREFNAWFDANKDKSLKEIIPELRNRETAAAHVKGVSDTAKPSRYWLSFNEWFADNTSRWATTAEKPVSLLDKFFKSVADTMRKLVAAVTGKKYAPNYAVAKFLDAMVDGRFQAEPINVPFSQPEFSRPPSTQEAAPTGGKKVIFAKPPYMEQAPSELWETAQGALGVLRDWTFTRGAFTRDLLDAAAKMMPAAQTYRDKMQRARVESMKLERDVAAITDAFAALPAHERGTGGRSVNALIRKMTYENKWAFAPSWVPNVTPDPELAEWFEKGLSADARKVVIGVFQHGHETLKQVQQAALDSIKSEVDPLIADARAKGDMATVKELEKAKVKADGKFRRLMELRGQTPYAPLRRFGNWAVVAKSRMYQDAEAAGDKDQMDKLSRDGKHYHVEFAPNRLAAAARAKKLKAAMGDVSVNHFERSDDKLLYGGESMFKAFSRFRTLAREEMADGDAKVVASLDKTLASMYMTLVAETSARTSEFERKNVSGADGDMMRAFATQGRAMANFIGSLKTSGEIMETLRTLKKQSHQGANQADKSVLYNEIMRRHAMGMNYEPNQLLDKSLAANSYWSLITSPSYFLTNLTQPWVASLPVLAGRFGVGRSTGEMFRAYKEIARIATKLVDNPGAVKDLPKDVQKVVEELLNRGSIDISVGADLGQFTSGGNSIVNAHMERAIRMPRTLAERGEMVNRVATAVAAYRLARGSMPEAAAIDYADKVIYETHGDYSAFNAPRVMRNAVGRFATQFRKFQLIQISLYARLFRDAFAKLPSEERFVARKALAYSLGMTFALGGMTAMPGYTAISFILGSVLGLGDDDEPDDPEATLRRALGGGPMAGLLIRGVPNLAGINIGSRIGAAGMLSILPYTDLEASRDGYKDILLGLAGPFVGGTLPKALDGLGLMLNGDYPKGLEMLLPRGLGDALKGVRFGTEGVTKRNGDVVLSGEEVSFLAAAAQAIGLPTTSITDNQMLRNSQFKADDFYKDRTTQLKRQYVEAYREGDGTKLQEVRQAWMETQEARKRLGYDVQPMSTLLKAPQEQRKREAKPLKTALVE